jgi:hypothetical protein
MWIPTSEIPEHGTGLGLQRQDRETGVLNLAETLLGLRRYLSAYASTGSRAALGSLEFAGQMMEMAVKLRGSGVSPAARVQAIAQAAGISRVELTRQILPALQELQLVDLSFQDDQLLWVAESIPPVEQLVGDANRMLDLAITTADERALLRVLDATATIPLTYSAAVEVACEDVGGRIDERAARTAIGHLEALGLLRRIVDDSGVDVVFNAKIWTTDRNYANAALRAEDGQVRRELMGLIQEISGTPGMPEDRVKSTEQRWINFAVSQGLVQRTSVVTVDADTKNFLFTPHLSRTPFGDEVPETLDPSGHVRQLIGSMVYASTFAQHRLWAPTAFLRAMLRNGEAGDASPIGTDYPMLETAGIVRVEPAARYSKMVLLQADVAEAAVQYIGDAGQSTSNAVVSLGSQVGYVDPDQSIARIGAEAQNPQDVARLMSALRETVRRGPGR